jgi:iron complex outermembrane receptor protein
MDGEKSWDLLAKAAWGDFSALLLHQTRDKVVPTAPYGAIFNDPGILDQDRHTLLGLQFNRRGGFADVSARLTYNLYQYRADWPLDGGGVRTLNRDTVFSQSVGSDLFASKTLGAHLVTIGMEQRWVLDANQKNADVAPEAWVYLDDRRHSLIQGYYVQDEYHLSNKLILNAGLRLDQDQTFGSNLNPRVALIWKPQSETVLRLSGGKAFRAPNAYEKYYSDQLSIEGNALLKPEETRSAELSWDQFIGNNLKTSMTLFHTSCSNLLGQVTDPANDQQEFINQRRTVSTGLDATLVGKWENGVSARFNYTYQDAFDPATGAWLANSPHSMVKSSLTLPLAWKPGFATLEALYGGPRRNLQGETLGGATVVNLTLLWRNPVHGLDLSASAYNLFDRRYAVPGGSALVNSLGETMYSIPQDGITFRLLATLRF